MMGQILERRCGMRFVAQLSIAIVGLDGVSVPGRLRNLSLSGAFVEVRGLQWKNLATVELHARCRSGEGTQCLVAPVMIVRSASDGVGLMFDSLNPPLVAAVRRDPSPGSRQGATRL